ncbi:MAG: hypothetical protein DCC75_00325 [Proteobacteria bacterium]|nr:MAG: hypothetical protein DCC75_00325 [Pseudomonadota bacterium]
MPHENPAGDFEEISPERLRLIAQLPLLLNSSLEVRRVIKVAVDHLKKALQAEVASIFLTGLAPNELIFWALEGGTGKKLEGEKMPAHRGIVGWVIDHKKSAWVEDVEKDSRFFKRIDQESGFKTKEMICVPLLVRGESVIGALQVINKIPPGSFEQQDVIFVERVASQVALAIENARLLETLMERNKSLEILEKRRSEMITLLNHELKTPLNLIQMSSDLILTELKGSSKTVEKIVQTLKNGVQRLTKVAAGLKNAAIGTESGLTVELVACQVASLIEAAAQGFDPIAKTRRLTLNREVASDVGRVMADSGLISIVLSNLLSNAVRFTPDQGTITIGAEKKAGLVKFFVRDTGIGIEKDQIPIIFEKFYEVKSAMEHSSGEYQFNSSGLGLGLATVKAALEVHRSKVEVQSTPGKGSTFWFSLEAVG